MRGNTVVVVVVKVKRVDGRTDGMMVGWMDG